MKLFELEQLATSQVIWHVRTHLSELIDHEIDLSVFEERYKNDATGAPAYDSPILLKIILFAYSEGITHGRQIEALCRENVVCMALSAHAVPHFTTIASFVSQPSQDYEIMRLCQNSGSEMISTGSGHWRSFRWSYFTLEYRVLAGDLSASISSLLFRDTS